jgi:hypothetical protein
MEIAPNIPADMIRPPVNRAMRVLDRSFFRKNVLLSAARINDRKQISKIRVDLGHDVLRVGRMQSVQSIRSPQGEESKAVLLHPRIKSDGMAIIIMKLRKDMHAYDYARFLNMECENIGARQIFPD